MAYITKREAAKAKYRVSIKGRETARAYSKLYYHAVLKHDPEEKAKRNFANRQRHYARYGITPEEAIALKKAGCSLCGKLEGKMNMDHDHRTQQLRGVLCNPCNLMIGWMERAEENLEKINAYLGRSYGSVE